MQYYILADLTRASDIYFAGFAYGSNLSSPAPTWGPVNSARKYTERDLTVLSRGRHRKLIARLSASPCAPR